MGLIFCVIIGILLGESVRASFGGVEERLDKISKKLE